jgi:DtxR family Mn-dependent transcriptional regulator
MPNSLIALISGIFFLVILAVIFWPDSGLYVRWQQIHRMSVRVLREDALKYLYSNELEGRQVTLQSLAGELEISLDDAAALLGEMTRLGLVEGKDDSYELTITGREVAVQVLRAHRLWEQYLHDYTGYSEEELHARAEEQEHRLAPEDVAALDERLGYPLYDPHGDPIPTAEGKVAAPKTLPLPQLEAGDIARVEHLEDQPEVVYAQLVAEGLHPGMEVLLLEKSPQRIRFLAQGVEHVLAPVLAANVFVIVIPKERAVEAARPPGEPLSALKPGEEAEVVLISHAMRPVERHRLMDLGVLPGTRVRAEFVSPTGEPVAYMIRGALIALRGEQADKIFIRREAAVPSGNGSGKKVKEHGRAEAGSVRENNG